MMSVMPRKVDPDDLVDAATVAELLGLGNRQSVSTYRARYADFPTPVVDLGPRRAMLWLRPEVEAWVVAHPRRG